VSDEYDNIEGVTKGNVNVCRVHELKRCEKESPVDMIKTISVIRRPILSTIPGCCLALTPTLPTLSKNRNYEVSLAGDKHGVEWLIGCL